MRLSKDKVPKIDRRAGYINWGRDYLHAMPIALDYSWSASYTDSGKLFYRVLLGECKYRSTMIGVSYE